MTSRDSERRRLSTTAGAVLWITAALGYFLLEAIAAAAVVPPYSYARNFISDLGVPAISPRAGLMNSAFYLQGILFLSGAVLTTRLALPGKARPFVGLAAVNAVGNILVATFTSGAGVLHTVGAVMAIGGGNAAILAGLSALHRAIGLRWYRAVSVALAGVGFLSLTMFWVGSSYLLPVGSTERASVYPILVWQTLTAVCLIARPSARC